MALKRAMLRAVKVHLVCPHCGRTVERPSWWWRTDALRAYTRADVLDILDDQERVILTCRSCGERYALHAATVDRVWPP